MTSLIVLGAERSGVSILAHALAHEEALPLCDDVALGAQRIAAGERLVVFAPEVAPDCAQLERMPAILDQCAEARALVVWRQGVDFVNSRLRARPDRHFVDHCLLWARSLEAAQRLQARFPDRVALIEFATLVDMASPEARGRVLVPGFTLTSDRLAKFLNASARGRTSLMPQRPVVDAARTAWAMGEVEAFARICGTALRSLGCEVDLAAAARRRPLDLGRLFYERAYRVGGAEIAPSPVPRAAWTLAFPEGPAAQLRLTAIAAGERRRLRLRWRARTAPAGRFRFEALEALTRRPLFVAASPEPDGADARIDAVLPAHDGMIEMAFAGAPGADPGARLDLVDVRLSHA